MGTHSRHLCGKELYVHWMTFHYPWVRKEPSPQRAFPQLLRLPHIRLMLIFPDSPTTLNLPQPTLQSGSLGPETQELSWLAHMGSVGD